MTYTAKVAVCSQIRTKHSMQSKHHVEFLKPLGFERLIGIDNVLSTPIHLLPTEKFFLRVAKFKLNKKNSQ
jgi:hypothetical protein